ncbi:hypothetical protein LB456_12080 [Psychroflexus sp. CAK57W]|uniref:hypothetical protein n=1 Tax=Psychroflexus curvus TaxID=2873595 RepID=UPI001CC94E60|nr:hypothetical protein [Psychroflexus curvus]MBZ9788198.1 hypothetical protein [Psychroflexus curvus]
MLVKNSNYLKSSVKELDNEIIFDPTESVFTNPSLPLTSDTISKCWKIYRYESSDGDDYEKIYISASEYNPKTDKKSFNYKKLNKIITITDLKLDLQNRVIELQEHYLSQISNILLHQSTDLQIKHELNHITEDIRKAITKLEDLETNKAQTVLKELLLRSYKEALEKINSYYPNYLPKISKPFLSIEDEKLNEFIYSDDLKKFKQLELNLISSSWVEVKGGLLFWKKNKNKLVDLGRFLKEKKILRENKLVPKFIRFLEERYNIDTGDQAKPNKYEKRKLKSYDYEFLLE